MSYARKFLTSPYFGIAAITLAAAFLRFYKLGEWSFWKDEIFTLGSKQDGLHLGFLGESLVRYAVKGVVSILGTSEWTARLVPALIGTFSIPALFFPIRTLFGLKNALLASSLLAVSPWHIYWSQTTRFYVLLMLFSALALLSFAISLKKKRPWLAGLALVFLFLATRESLVALLNVPIATGYFLFLWFTSGKSFSGLGNRYVLILLFLLGILAIYFAAPYLRDLPAWFAGFGRINNSPLWILAASAYYIGIPAMWLGGISALSLLVRRTSTAYLLVWWAFFPLASIMLLSLIQYSATRYIFITLPAWLILASLAVTELLDQTTKKNALLSAGLLALMLVTSLSEDMLYYYYQNGNREDGRGAFTYIRANLQPNDLVVASDPEVGNYYLGQQTYPMELMDPARFSRFQRIWFVEDLDSDDLYPGQMIWIRDHADLNAIYDVHASVRLFTMRVYLLEVPQSDG